MVDGLPLNLHIAGSRLGRDSIFALGPRATIAFSIMTWKIGLLIIYCDIF